ncbi:hypothetical protein FACS189438_2150 [Bacteroidia bacterium]|nr:hypothetical protein FACS189438_2150 [Bacteroidia bacterium]
MKTKNIFSPLGLNGVILAIILSGCIVDETTVYQDSGTVEITAQPVVFATRTGDVIHTRTTGKGNLWAENDSIGIYMLDKQENALDNSLAYNRKYFVKGFTQGDTDTSFVPASPEQTIYYPSSDNVRFIAYYPFKKTGALPGYINNYKYPIVLTRQQDTALIDVLYSNNLTDKAKDDEKAILQFNHVLAKLVINVLPESGTDISTAGMKASIDSMTANASFNLANSTFTQETIQNFNMFGVGKMTPDYNRDDTVFQAIIIPHTTEEGEKVQFVTSKQQFTWKIPAGTEFNAGKVHTYTITLKGNGSTNATNP